MALCTQGNIFEASILVIVIDWWSKFSFNSEYLVESSKFIIVYFSTFWLTTGVNNSSENQSVITFSRMNLNFFWGAYFLCRAVNSTSCDSALTIALVWRWLPHSLFMVAHEFLYVYKPFQRTHHPTQSLFQGCKDHLVIPKHFGFFMCHFPNRLIPVRY